MNQCALPNVAGIKGLWMSSTKSYARLVYFTVVELMLEAVYEAEELR